jgi:hypothetical protein
MGGDGVVNNQPAFPRRVFVEFSKSSGVYDMPPAFLECVFFYALRFYLRALQPNPGCYALALRSRNPALASRSTFI